MSAIKDFDWLDEAFENARINNLKDNFEKYDTADAYVEENIKNNLGIFSNNLEHHHRALLNNLEKVLDGNMNSTKFESYKYFKDYCYKLKSDFKSNYKFTIVQKPTDENFNQTIINIEIITSTQNYNLDLTNYKYHKNYYEAWFNIDDEDYYLHCEDNSLSSLICMFNLKKMLKQILTKNKEHKIYKLDLKSNAKRFLLSKQPKELINEKAQITVKKIEDIKKSNFDKEDMTIFWHSYISDDRNFCDVIFALIEHKKNNDNIKFNQKLEKTAKALNLPTSILTPFLIKYLILWTEEQNGFNKHLESLSKLILNDELEEKTNIRDVAKGKTKANKNRFCLDSEKKLLIDVSLENLEISNDTDYIKTIDQLRGMLEHTVEILNMKEDLRKTMKMTMKRIKDESFKMLVEDIEQSIEEYNEELMHTVKGKKEYVFKEDEVVGSSSIKFNKSSKDVIDGNKYMFDVFIKSLDIKFPNIVAKYDDGVLEYKLLNQISKKKVA